MKKMITLAVMTAFLGVSMPMMAYADHHEAELLAKAKVSLVEAIQAAEKSVGGKAYDASLDDDATSPEYEVNVMKDGKSFDVRVNGGDGSVISSREDIDD